MKGTGVAKQSDPRLIERFLDGEIAAFEELVRRYEGPLVHFLMRYVRDPMLAEELFQETFVRVYKKAASFDLDRHFKTWLYTIALNLARTAIRRRRTREISLEADYGGEKETSLRETLPADIHSPEDLAAGSELAREIEKAVQSLTEKQREVFILYQYDGCSYEEISKITKRPPGTVKSQMHYAIKELRRKLEHIKNYEL
ncbi:MAG: sigma-70 family RNA polymerase sigma factor [Planctomycetota bacterium]|nr:MAG: sigma-70 family RNA polymerase sigma factor [Planctomycetota bacterium]